LTLLNFGTAESQAALGRCLPSSTLLPTPLAWNLCCSSRTHRDTA
jgi:hypothetical protein